MTKTDEYRLLVSEPWDFDGPDGQNQIIGTIIKVIDPCTVVFEANNEIGLQGLRSKQLLLCARHAKELLVHDGLIAGAVNGGILCSSNFEGKTKRELETNSKFVFIGNIEKLQGP